MTTTLSAQWMERGFVPVVDVLMPEEAIRYERFVAWHQDVTYWGLEPPRAVTAWIAIDDVDVENGCMQVIPGSYRLGILEHGKSPRAGNLLSINQEVPDGLVDESRAVSMPLRAGRMSLHDGMLLHGSHPNRSSRRRCGLAVRFTTPDVRQVSPNSLRGHYRPVLVRGADPVEVPWRAWCGMTADLPGDCAAP